MKEFVGEVITIITLKPILSIPVGYTDTFVLTEGRLPSVKKAFLDGDIIITKIGNDELLLK